MDIYESDPKLVAVLIDIMSNNKEMVNILNASLDPKVDILPYMEALFDSDSYPVAVDPLLLNQSDEEKAYRAQLILELIVRSDCDNIKFLDYGCGEGFVCAEAAKKAKVAVGYDIRQYPNWSSPNLTTDFSEVEKHAPYDVILLYDVLDHVENDTPVGVLQKVRQLLKFGGKIVVRCHPWCARDGAHIESTINRAYAHLILDIEQPHNLKVIHPHSTYESWIREAELKYVDKVVVREQEVPHVIINNPLLLQIIKKNWKQSPDLELARGIKTPIAQLKVQYIDFVLTRSVEIKW